MATLMNLGKGKKKTPDGKKSNALAWDDLGY